MIDRLVRIHEEAYKNITGILEVGEQQKRFVCFIHERKDKKGRYGWNSCDSFYHTVYNEERVGKAYSGPHELAHKVVTGELGIYVFGFWSEAVATLLGGYNISSVDFHAAESMSSNAIFSLEAALHHDTFQKIAPIDAYAQAASFFQFIVSRLGGWIHFIDFLKELSKKTHEAVSIFKQHFQIPLPDVRKQWEEYIYRCYLDNKEEIERQKPYWSARINFYYKNYRLTLQDIEAYISNNEEDPYGYYLAGLAHFEMGNIGKAADTLVRVSSLPVVRTEDARIYRESLLYLGMTQDLLDKRAAAINYYNRIFAYPDYDNTHKKARRYLDSPYSQNK